MDPLKWWWTPKSDNFSPKKVIIYLQLVNRARWYEYQHRSPPKSSTQNLWNLTKIFGVWAKQHRFLQICGVWVKHHRFSKIVVFESNTTYFFLNTIWAVFCHCLCAFVSSSLSFCLSFFLFPIFCSVCSEMCSVAASIRKFDWKWLWLFWLQHLTLTLWNLYLKVFAPSTSVPKLISNQYVISIHRAEGISEKISWC